ncbi:MAG TPA: hypothetical protein VN083_06195 [Vicinamibacteria bacterium]|nr:hypothetical protein [Vicinamibacteria bacterium]
MEGGESAFLRDLLCFFHGLRLGFWEVRRDFGSQPGSTWGVDEGGGRLLEGNGLRQALFGFLFRGRLRDPGLRSLASLRGLASLCGGRLAGFTLRLNPGRKGGLLEFALGLVLLAPVDALLFCGEGVDFESALELVGGVLVH